MVGLSDVQRKAPGLWPGPSSRVLAGRRRAEDSGKRHDFQLEKGRGGVPQYSDWSGFGGPGRLL